MNRIFGLVVSLLILGSPSLTLAGPKEDVAAATQAWINAMSSHDAERVVALYDSEAVLWGTRSPTLRDNPATVRDYFNILAPFLHRTRLSLVSNVFASTVTLPSTPGRILFRRSATAKKSLVRRGSALSTGIAAGAG